MKMDSTLPRTHFHGGTNGAMATTPGWVAAVLVTSTTISGGENYVTIEIPNVGWAKMSGLDAILLARALECASEQCSRAGGDSQAWSYGPVSVGYFV